jgi:hypothetical protein
VKKRKLSDNGAEFSEDLSNTTPRDGTTMLNDQEEPGPAHTVAQGKSQINLLIFDVDKT